MKLRNRSPWVQPGIPSQIWLLRTNFDILRQNLTLKMRLHPNICKTHWQLTYTILLGRNFHVGELQRATTHDPTWARPTCWIRHGIWDPQTLGGMVTLKFWSELPSFNKWLDSNLVPFHAHDFLDGHRQLWAYSVSAPFVDTGHLVVICWNYLGTRF